MKQIPLQELDHRLRRLRKSLGAVDPDWSCAVVMGKVNLYYLTGTMPSGALVVPRDSEATLWVRRSFQRAREESAFPDIRRMRSFRDIGECWQPPGGTVHLETEVVTLAHFERFNKHLGFAAFAGIDHAIGAVRAVKSEWELQIMRRSGKLHREMLEERIPGLLSAGMTEAALGAVVLKELLEAGYQGVTRVGMFDTDLCLGNFCFGDSAVYPNSFDGPGGLRGLCPAAPLIGSRKRKLRYGDLVFVDVGLAMEGYHTDKTMVYAFGFSPSPELRHAQETCIEIHNRAAELLTPGTLASAVFDQATAGLPEAFRPGFMGVGDQQVKFLGHGVGLHIDELPVIAPGFDAPLEANMTIAVEPKIGFPGVGMVGIENTFQVTPSGGISLTGSHPGLMQV